MEKKNFNSSKNDNGSSKSSSSSDVEIKMQKKTISFGLALSITIGTIIGSGIFVTAKDSFNVFSSDSIGMVMVFWVIGGVISLILGLCYAELGTRIPESGGERAYYKKILDEKCARIFVIFSVFIIKTLTLAALSVTTAKYLIVMIGLNAKNDKLEKILAITALFLCLIVNLISKSIAMKAGVVLTILKTVAILIIVSSGLYYMGKGAAKEWNTPFTFQNLSVKNLGQTVNNILFTYDGSNTIGLIAGDMKNPTRDLPLAIITGVSIVSVFYVTAVLSYSAVLGYSVAKKSNTLAVAVAYIIFGKFYWIMAILVSCSSLGAANCCLYAISTVSVSAGYSGELPKMFSLVHKRTRTPIFSLVVVSVISSSFTFLPLGQLFNYCTFLTWIFYFLSFFCLWKIKLQTRGRRLVGVFNVPYVIIIPAQVTCIFVIIMSFYISWFGCTVFATFFVLVCFLQYVPFNYSRFSIFSRFEDHAINVLCKTFNLELANERDIS